MANQINSYENKLLNRDFLLAKSIYDNFVDRGLIEDDLDFQKAFYDFIFEDKQIKTFPIDFQFIFMKVSGK